ncbi:hypothetical protein [Coxiella burnetii]|uniref:hypothetical protein n=1 Tax=Coxiella burnetii TaxID=777 RepID=UPI0000ED0315|nr:hypothetical protein [Coxiella burnetii]ACJ19946.1 Fic family protein [Coxiella burnetii CbuK_Q154]EAX32829.1 hypothetical protein A35_03420 [Coxiella burnetii 'MSU Goat Q177']UYK70426.1 hypothetical protein OHM78_04110 [Coxiella burnetii]
MVIYSESEKSVTGNPGFDFFRGRDETANQAVKTAKNISQLFTEDRQKIENFGRPAASALLVHHYLEKHSVTDIITGKERHKIYTYQRYLDILNEGIGDF